MQTARVFAPGTIANVGSGFDCLGLCLDGIGDEVTVGPSPSGHDEVFVTGRDASRVPLDPRLNCAAVAAAAARTALGREETFRIQIERALPLSGGLGASAAASVGGALAAAYAFGARPRLSEILDWALAGEEAVAGRHLDNIAPCLLGGMTLSFFAAASPEAGRPIVRAFDVVALGSRRPLWMAVITPRLRIETRAARALLPESVGRATYAEGLARASAVVAAFLTADHELLGAGLEDPFAVPARKGLIPGFDRAREVALSAGALGFSISGSGPTLFAPCQTVDAASDVAERVVEVFREVGASSLVCQIAGLRSQNLNANLGEPNSAGSGVLRGATCVSLTASS